MNYGQNKPVRCDAIVGDEIAATDRKNERTQSAFQTQEISNERNTSSKKNPPFISKIELPNSAYCELISPYIMLHGNVDD